MMLKALLPKPEQRYAAAGAAIGALFPVICTFYDRMNNGVHGLWGSSTPLAASIAVVLMPLICGAFFYQGGRARSRLLQELEQSRKSEHDLSHALHTDQLTGIANRFALEQDLRERLSAGPVAVGRTTLLLLDLDRFKFVNDSMGHDAGDELLIALADRLIRALSGVATVYRLGGDEFVVMVAGAPSNGKIDDICATVKALFATPFQLSSAQFWTGGSIGVAYIEPGDRSISAVLKRADLALYKAKEIAGNSHAIYEPAMAAEAATKGEVEYDLARALAAGEFFLEYQPIVGIESRAIRSFEALIRWRHPEKGVLAPDRFIGAAEKTGLILPIGNWVVRTACLEAARWPVPTGIAVNVAQDQFKDRAFVPYVKACLAEAGLAPGRLTLEITESVLSADTSFVRDSLAELRAHGVRIALDDFGVGLSSINNLKRFPLDQIKLDRSFAGSMLGNEIDAQLVNIILQLGSTFQVSTAVEGVRGLGASEAQGFLISRPVSAGDAMAILQCEPAKGAARSIG
jgi:diguanylate cyclase (GGDEF)-like protein